MRPFVHYVGFFLGGKCVSTHVTLFYHEITVYQLFFCKIFRHPSPVIVSWSWQPWRSQDRGLSLLQRSNGSGRFSGSGLNITTRVSKNKLDAHTHPNWYPLGYIFEWFQFPIGFVLHSSVDVNRYLPSQNPTLGPSTDAACFIGLWRAVTPPIMASVLVYEGLLAAHRVSRPIKGLSTGLREVVGPEKLIWMKWPPKGRRLRHIYTNPWCHSPRV
jgi:hypothetical protein